MSEDIMTLERELDEINRDLEILLAKKNQIGKQLDRTRKNKDNFIHSFGFTPVSFLPTKGKTVAYCGVPGAYAYEAILQFFGKNTIKMSMPSFTGAMEAITRGKADYAILPIENSTAGAVGDVYDLLAKYQHFVVGEVIVPVHHCLLGLPGTTFSDILQVHSHPQAIQQCRSYLLAHPDWQECPRCNTAGSAKWVAETGDKTQVAIASRTAGELYGLEILEEGINQEEENTTRFVVISPEKIYQGNANKVKICFECQHREGALYHLLAHFTFHHLSMTRIESRPIPEKNWQYRFFVDFEGNLAQEQVQSALCGLREESAMLRILGNV